MDEISDRHIKGNDVGLTWVEVVVKKHAAGNRSFVIESIDGVENITPASFDHEGDKDITSKGDLGHVLPMAFHDVRDMGLCPITTTRDESPMKCKTSWIVYVDKIMNAERSNGDQPQCDLDVGRHQNEESPSYF
ncbi:hypothetical protein V6N13_014826 [Hibiscus sabdariffa]|uniref:Uncharacterized protein n=1 Tax=Hibiscus sabdariffa TaxID=183260 RepID=A0ABR2RX26_9ROSI